MRRLLRITLIAVALPSCGEGQRECEADPTYPYSDGMLWGPCLLPGGACFQGVCMETADGGSLCMPEECTEHPNCATTVMTPSGCAVACPDAACSFGMECASIGGVAGCVWPSQKECGWEELVEAYLCGVEGEDPSGQFPRACPAGLVEGEACGTVKLEGCCDTERDNWYCDFDETLQVASCDPAGP